MPVVHCYFVAVHHLNPHHMAIKVLVALLLIHVVNDAWRLHGASTCRMVDGFCFSL